MCECCYQNRSVRWYLIDENAEVELCTKCAKQLKSEMEVTPIKVWG